MQLTIFYHGTILTMNDSQPSVQAIVVEGEKIVFVGTESDAFKLKKADTILVDLKNKAMLPGFIEPHTHMMTQGLTQIGLDLNPFVNKKMEQVIALLKKRAAQGPVLAFNFDPSLMSEAANLDMHQLDAISGNVPVLVLNKSLHIAYGNQLIFEQAGVNKDTPDPSGGSYEHDAAGNLTGRAYELLAVATLFGACIKKIPLDYAALARTAAQEYARCGYTTITDMALGLPLPTPLEHIQVMKNIAREDQAIIRVQGYVPIPLLDHIPALMKNNDARFTVNGVKIWADGSTQGHTAAVNEPYLDTHTQGTLNFSQEQLNKMVLSAVQLNVPLAIHANGDRAIDAALTAYEHAQKNEEQKDPRFRIEHCTLAHEKDFQRIAAVKATPSFTNQHIYYWGSAFKNTILGEPRADLIDSARTALKHGLKFSFHDDAPLGALNPLLMIQIAVTREMADGGVLNPAQTISVMEALKAFTIYPAWQSFRDHELGSIEVGKYADFVVLDKNPLEVPVHEIKDIQVEQTWVGGKKYPTE